MSKWLLLALLTGGALARVPLPQLPVPPEVCDGPVPVSTVEAVISPMVYSGGTVVARVLVAADGSVTDVELVTPFPALTEPVVAAVRKWRFRPAMREGNAVAGCVIVAVQISLNRVVIGPSAPVPRR